MPKEAVGTTIRPDLAAMASEISLDSMNQGFIADRVMPVFRSSQRSGEFPVIEAREMLRVPDVRRAPSGHYNREDWEYSSQTFTCQDYGLEGRLADDEASQFQYYGDAEYVTVRRTMTNVLRAREKRVADLLFNPSTFTVHNVSTPWSTTGSCTPRSDVMEGIKAMRDATGLNPNVVVIPWAAYQNVLLSAEFKEHVQYTIPVLTRPANEQLALLADYFSVSEVLVAGAPYNAANKGLAVSLSDIWSSNYVLIARVATDPMDLREPCVGRTFLWTADSPELVTVEEYREEQTRSTIYRVRHYVDERVMFTGAAYLLGNIT